MSRKVSLFRSLDWITILLYVTLVTIGWFAIYSSTYDFENPTILNFSARHGSQLIWIGFAFLLALITILIDSKMYNNLAYIIYFLIINVLRPTSYVLRSPNRPHLVKIPSFVQYLPSFRWVTTVLRRFNDGLKRERPQRNKHFTIIKSTKRGYFCSICLKLYSISYFTLVIKNIHQMSHPKNLPDVNL